MWLKKETQKYLSTFLDILWFRAYFPWWEVRWCSRERLERERPTISRTHPSQLGEFLLLYPEVIQYITEWWPEHHFFFFFVERCHQCSKPCKHYPPIFWLANISSVWGWHSGQERLDFKPCHLSSVNAHSDHTTTLCDSGPGISYLGFHGNLSPKKTPRKEVAEELVSWENMGKNKNANFLQGITILNVG